MSRNLRCCVLASGLLLLVLGPVAALSGENFLSGSFWWERQPFIGGVDYPQTDQEALTWMLQEARWVFSGMIYGFSFRYVPGDTRQEVERSFELAPLGEIPWGDPSLTVLGARADRDRYRADIGFELSGMYLARRQAWESNIHPPAEGLGEALLFEGFSSRQKAMEEAIRTAVHTYVRQRTGTRPREISGELSLADVPYIRIVQGSYQARVRIRMRLEITEQMVY